MDDFDNINGTVESKERTATVAFVVRVYGTEQQLDQKIQKIRKELQLQGVDPENFTALTDEGRLDVTL